MEKMTIRIQSKDLPKPRRGQEQARQGLVVTRVERDRTRYTRKAKHKGQWPFVLV